MDTLHQAIIALSGCVLLLTAMMVWHAIRIAKIESSNKAKGA